MEEIAVCKKCKKEKAIDEFWSERYNKRVVNCISCREIASKSKKKKVFTVVKFMNSDGSCFSASCKVCGVVKSAANFTTKYKNVDMTYSCKECREKVNTKLKRTGKVKGNKAREIIKHIVSKDGEVSKKCSACKILKELKEFHAKKSSGDGKNSVCKKCAKSCNPEGKAKARKKYLSKPENKARSLAIGKIWQSNNRDRINARKRERRQKDPIYKLTENIRRRTQEILRQGWSKSGKTLDLLGCSPQDLRNHLEDNFSPHMSWNNQGGEKGWHIDHIVPINSFDLSKEEEQRKCFHYTNLQPLWWFHNLEKHVKIVDRENDFTWYE